MFGNPISICGTAESGNLYPENATRCLSGVMVLEDPATDLDYVAVLDACTGYLVGLVPQFLAPLAPEGG